METRLAFFRHPLEIFANTLYLILIGKLIMNVSVEVIMFALAIEGSLEIFHHSNIRLPRYLKFIGYIIQKKCIWFITNINYTAIIIVPFYGTWYLAQSTYRMNGIKHWVLPNLVRFGHLSFVESN